MPPTLYDELQVTPQAEPVVVQAAYRALARAHHPDHGGDPAAMRRLNGAYAVLRDPEQRAAYDAALRQPCPSAPRAPLETPAYIRGGLRRRVQRPRL